MGLLIQIESSKIKLIHFKCFACVCREEANLLEENAIAVINFKLLMHWCNCFLRDAMFTIFLQQITGG